MNLSIVGDRIQNGFQIVHDSMVVNMGVRVAVTANDIDARVMELEVVSAVNSSTEMRKHRQ